MRSKRLTLRESRRFVWLTCFEFVIVGIIVYFFTNPTSVALLLAVPVVLHALINFWVKFDGVSVSLHLPSFTVFVFVGGLTGLGSMVALFVNDFVMNSWARALNVIFLGCSICALKIGVASEDGKLVRKSFEMKKIRTVILSSCGGFLLKKLGIQFFIGSLH